MWKTKTFIVLSVVFILATSLGLFDIATVTSSYSGAHRYETPIIAVIVSFAWGIGAVIAFIMLLSAKDTISKLRSKITMQSGVVKIYQDQLKDLNTDCDTLIKSADKEMGTNIPLSQLLTQIGGLRVKIADAEAVSAEALVEYRECKYSVGGYMYVYFWNSIIDKEEAAA